MPIKVTCSCGQQFLAKDELAGKKVQCPKCRSILTVGAAAGVGAGSPPSSAVATLLDEVGFRVESEKEEILRCPACNEPIEHNSLLCIQCGYNLETGKFIRGAGGAGARTRRKLEGHEAAAEMLLRKAENTIEQDRDEERKIRTQGMPLWMLVTLLSIVATFTIGMSVLPADQAFMISGYVWVCVCGGLAVVYWFRMVYVAFQESPKQGLLFEFVPFYAVYYVSQRWATCGKLFLTHVILLLLAPIGLALISIAPSMKPSQQEREVGASPHSQFNTAVATAGSLRSDPMPRPFGVRDNGSTKHSAPTDGCHDWPCA